MPVNTDIGEPDALFVGPPDMNVNAPDVRGIGETGITSVPATISNAVYHATGVRARNHAEQGDARGANATI